ncbi:hypothetical protein KIPB_010888 [Kipferlia bialata]|uniref:Zinc-ribbon domain-containing protein n=1 Tax=Kipferlia bialata TaxID=797122 RepID=A0A9K3D3W7_9EUKA|nr:hypothetical protein KIPB_010888 [Kipferlia bialata]|eukprot:g10888.t1
MLQSVSVVKKTVSKVAIPTAKWVPPGGEPDAGMLDDASSLGRQGLPKMVMRHSPPRATPVVQAQPQPPSPALNNTQGSIGGQSPSGLPRSPSFVGNAGQEQERDTEKERERERGRERDEIEKKKERERDSDHGRRSERRERDSGRDRERESRRDRESRKERESKRERERERDGKGKERRHSDRDRERERDKSSRDTKGRDREREREREKDKPRRSSTTHRSSRTSSSRHSTSSRHKGERERDRDRERERDHRDSRHREREGDREREYSRDPRERSVDRRAAPLDPYAPLPYPVDTPAHTYQSPYQRYPPSVSQPPPPAISEALPPPVYAPIPQGRCHFCVSCGARFHPDAAFCGNCGVNRRHFRDLPQYGVDEGERERGRDVLPERERGRERERWAPREERGRRATLSVY